MSASIKVEGLAELRLALRAVDAAAPKELVKAHKMAGQMVTDAQIERAPHGPHQGGGSIIPIASSIQARASQAGVVVTAGGPQSPHAIPEEFGGTIARKGHRGESGKRHIRRTGGSGGRTHIAKRPYFYAGFDAVREQVMDTYLAALDRALALFGK